MGMIWSWPLGQDHRFEIEAEPDVDGMAKYHVVAQ